MQLTYNNIADGFDPNSRVWVYNSNRPLTDDEIRYAQAEIDYFVKEWAAHGNELKATGAILYDRFLVLVVDETHEGASGCSIDSSVKFIKELGAKLNIDFFNRLNLVIEENNELMYCHISELAEHPNSFVFNPMVTNLGEFRSSWRQKSVESPLLT